MIKHSNTVLIPRLRNTATHWSLVGTSDAEPKPDKDEEEEEEDGDDNEEDEDDDRKMFSMENGKE